MPEQGLAEPHADNMADDERWNAQAEHELQRFDRFPVKFPALIKRPNPEAGVKQRRGIKYDRHREELPERFVVMDTGGKGIQGDIAERVVEEMADQIGQQHQATGETNLPDTDAADELCDPVFS